MFRRPDPIPPTPMKPSVIASFGEPEGFSCGAASWAEALGPAAVAAAPKAE